MNERLTRVTFGTPDPTMALAKRARKSWREALLSADRPATHAVHVQFRHRCSDLTGLSTARAVRDGLGQLTGSAALHFAVAEPNTDRAGHHLHILYWLAAHAGSEVLRSRWESHAASMVIHTVWDDRVTPDELDERDLGGPRSRPLSVAVEYATKWFHLDGEVSYDPSPKLLQRIGVKVARAAA